MRKDRSVLLKLVLVWWVKEEMATPTGVSGDGKERQLLAR